jgi:2',3'-cyclic-nucleotide 2'-phosphodiesterase (5'-nucleotidase family)
MGEVIVAGMNLMGYDAMALGPKELSMGGELLQARMDEAQFPILSANSLWSSTVELVAEPYTLLQVGSRRIGVIGLTRLPDVEYPDFEVLEPKESLSQYVTEVEEQVDTVLLLTNLPYKSALEMVEDVPGVDLVVAALPGQLPERAVRVPATGTLAVTAEQALPRHAGRRVGRLAVTVGRDGSLGGEAWASIPLGPQVADDLEMEVLLDGYR